MAYIFSFGFGDGFFSVENFDIGSFKAVNAEFLILDIFLVIGKVLLKICPQDIALILKWQKFIKTTSLVYFLSFDQSSNLVRRNLGIIEHSILW